MKIKHFTGYGSVEATKINKISEEGRTWIVIKVKGNHEYGVHRDDAYDIAKWLLPKFSKEFKDGQKSYRNIEYLDIVDGYEKDDKGEYIDTCLYKIMYN